MELEILNLIFVGISIFGAVMCLTQNSSNRMIIWVWLSGLAMGAYLLNLKLDFLAIMLWLCSSLFCVAMIFISSLVGNHSKTIKPLIKKETAKLVFFIFLSASYIIVFFSAFFKQIEMGANLKELPQISLQKFGIAFVNHQWLSLIVLAILFVLIAVGAGIERDVHTEEDK